MRPIGESSGFKTAVEQYCDWNYNSRTVTGDRITIIVGAGQTGKIGAAVGVGVRRVVRSVV